jgi:hypothetical protein
MPKQKKFYLGNSTANATPLQVGGDFMSRKRSAPSLLYVQGFATFVAVFKTEVRAQLISNCFKRQNAKVYQGLARMPTGFSRGINGNA